MLLEFGILGQINRQGGRGRVGKGQLGCAVMRDGAAPIQPLLCCYYSTMGNTSAIWVSGSKTLKVGALACSSLQYFTAYRSRRLNFFKRFFIGVRICYHYFVYEPKII